MVCIYLTTLPSRAEINLGGVNPYEKFSYKSVWILRFKGFQSNDLGLQNTIIPTYKLLYNSIFS